MMDDDFAAGSSAARNKLKNYLQQELGLQFPFSPNPPKDEDFGEAIQEHVNKIRSHYKNQIRQISKQVEYLLQKVTELMIPSRNTVKIQFRDNTNRYRVEIPTLIFELFQQGMLDAIKLFENRFRFGSSNYHYYLEKDARTQELCVYRYPNGRRNKRLRQKFEAFILDK